MYIYIYIYVFAQEFKKKMYISPESYRIRFNIFTSVALFYLEKGKEMHFKVLSRSAKCDFFFPFHILQKKKKSKCKNKQ